MKDILPSNSQGDKHTLVADISFSDKGLMLKEWEIRRKRIYWDNISTA